MPLTPESRQALKAKIRSLIDRIDHLKKDRDLVSSQIANLQVQKQRLQDVFDEILSPDVDRQTLVDYIMEV